MISSAKLLVTGLVVATALLGSAAAAESAALAERLRNRLETTGDPASLTVGGTPLQTAKTLRRFYQSRAYEPVRVVGAHGRDRLAELNAEIAASAFQGLQPGINPPTLSGTCLRLTVPPGSRLR
jgi:hypothetical protein